MNAEKQQWRKGQRVYIPWLSDEGFAKLRVAEIIDEEPDINHNIVVKFEDTGVMGEVHPSTLREIIRTSRAPANDVHIPSIPPSSSVPKDDETERAQVWVSFLERFEGLRREQKRFLQEWRIVDPLDFDRIVDVTWRLQNCGHKLQALRREVLALLRVSLEF